MGLPFILDVALGLIFIYLILSLLASELQELLTALLQWRAKHLKDAIEVLLSGGAGTPESDQVKALVNDLYEHPLLKNINQAAKGRIPTAFRAISSKLFPMSNAKGAFGKNQATGPSYIAPETFASSLIERLRLPLITDLLMKVRLEKFATRIVGVYSINSSGDIEIFPDEAIENNWEKGQIRLLAKKLSIPDWNFNDSFRVLLEDYKDILDDFNSGKAILTTCIERMEEGLNNYIGVYQDKDPNSYYQRLASYKLAVFGKDNERAVLSGGLKPSISEIAELINDTSSTYQEIADFYDTLIKKSGTIESKISPAIEKTLRQMQGFNASELAQLDAPPAESENSPLPSEASEAGISDLNSPIIGLDNPTAQSESSTSKKRQQIVIGALSRLTNEDRQLVINQALNTLEATAQLTDEERKVYQTYRSYYETYYTYRSLKEVIGKIPASVKESLSSLAHRAQVKAQKTESDINQFEEEVALWFDRSMERASGVYKRNAKGVAILIGLVLALFTNSDAFYITDRLTNDENLRKVVTDRATQLSLNTPDSRLTPEQLKQIRNSADDALRDLALPIGFSPVNLSKQFNCHPPTPASNTTGTAAPVDLPTPDRWSDFYQTCLGPQAPKNPMAVAQVIVTKPWDFLRILFGWLITSIAISMGAPFWFDLLSKIVNVRASGNKPVSAASRNTTEE